MFSALMKVLIVVVTVAWSVHGEFPDDPKPCKQGDAKCIGNIVNYVTKEKFAGDTSLGLTAIDPLPISKLHIKRGADSPVNIDLLFTNNVATGIKTSTFLKIKGFGKEIATKHEIVSKLADKLDVVGDYKISGKVLFLPIQGSGKSRVTLVEPTITLSWIGVPYEKNGETYMKLDKFSVDLEPKKIIFNFENLFNDKTLSDNMNTFLTENWNQLYPEIRDSLGHGLSLVTRSVIQNVFDKYPYSKLITE